MLTFSMYVIGLQQHTIIEEKLNGVKYSYSNLTLPTLFYSVLIENRETVYAIVHLHCVVRSVFVNKGQGKTDLEAVGMDDLITDGALHEHGIKLLVFVVERVFFTSLAAHHTYCCMW